MAEGGNGGFDQGQHVVSDTKRSWVKAGLQYLKHNFVVNPDASPEPLESMTPQRIAGLIREYFTFDQPHQLQDGSMSIGREFSIPDLMRKLKYDTVQLGSLKSFEKRHPEAYGKVKGYMDQWVKAEMLEEVDLGKDAKGRPIEDELGEHTHYGPLRRDLLDKVIAGNMPSVSQVHDVASTGATPPVKP